MKLRKAVRLSQPVLVLLFFNILNTVLVLPQERPAPPPPTMPGMTVGPPSMGDWYRPPVFENRQQPRMSVLEFAPNSQEKRLLAVAPEDLQVHATFLRGRETGAFRLLPPYPYNRRVVSANSPAAGWRSGFSAFASTYSFVKKKHGHGVNGWGSSRFGWSDLKFANGSLSSAVMDQSLGLMVQLGDVALETVTSDSAGLAELVQLDLPVDQAGAELLLAKHRSGYRVNGFVYSSRMPAVVNTTYVLRSVMNKRVDHLIAFRVVRKDDDGVTIVWKRLEKYAKPSWKTKAGK
ncbi:MAG TPA: hypothetical protein VFT02_12100 [Pyrinomonadaceae bacterium]|nr:hypothetical protein [Pyrinomonadaceae bacterium]